MKKNFLLIIYLILIIVLSYPAIKHLLLPGFFPMHDDTQVVRVSQMAQALKEGQFPVRWVGDLGYGYGYTIFNFYNPFPYYVGAVFNLIGFDVLVATKLMFIIGFLLAGLGMFLLARLYFGSFGGLLASLFYLYSPYHAVQVYVRGSLAELWAYGILPFIFWSIIKKKSVLSGIFLALLITSHNLTAMLALPIILILFFLDSQYRNLIISFLIGLSLSAFFWIPAITEKGYTGVDQMVEQKFNFLENFVYPRQLWNSPWGYGGSVPGELDGMSFQIGRLHIIASLFALSFMIIFWHKEKAASLAIFSGISLLIFSIFMMHPISSGLWKTLMPVARYLQFPWRLLTFTALSSSFLAGSLFLWSKLFKKKIIQILMLFLILIILILMNYKYFKPLYLYPAKGVDLVTEEKIRWDASRISDEYLPIGFIRPAIKENLFRQKFQFQQDGQIIQNKIRADFFELNVNTNSENVLIANIAYFPGWKAWLDNNPVNISPKNDLINLTVPPGRHKVILKFTNTPIRIVANLISLLCLFYLLSLLI